MNEYSNLSPQEKREKEYKEYERFVALALIPLALYLFWPLLFGQKNVEQAQVTKQRIESVDKKVEESIVVENKPIEATAEPKRKIAPVAPIPKKSNQIRNTPPAKRKPVTRPQNNNTFTLTYNRGDKIEYLIGPQKTGWKGIVQGKNNGNYTVKITDVLLANDKQQYLATNNPCNGNKPIGKKAINQVIIVPGSCIHQK